MKCYGCRILAKLCSTVVLSQIVTRIRNCGPLFFAGVRKIRYSGNGDSLLSYREGLGIKNVYCPVAAVDGYALNLYVVGACVELATGVRKFSNTAYPISLRSILIGRVLENYFIVSKILAIERRCNREGSLGISITELESRAKRLLHLLQA